MVHSSRFVDQKIGTRTVKWFQLKAMNEALMTKKGVDLDSRFNDAQNFGISVILRKKHIDNISELLANIKAAKIDKDQKTITLIEKALMAGINLAYNSIGEYRSVTLNLDLLKPNNIIKKNLQNETILLMDKELEIEDMVPIFVRMNVVDSKIADKRSSTEILPYDGLRSYMGHISLNESIKTCYFYKAVLNINGGSVSDIESMINSIVHGQYTITKKDLDAIKIFLSLMIDVGRTNKKNKFIFIANLEKFMSKYLNDPKKEILINKLQEKDTKKLFEHFFEKGVIDIANGSRSTEGILPGLRQTPAGLLYPQ